MTARVRGIRAARPAKPARWSQAWYDQQVTLAITTLHGSDLTTRLEWLAAGMEHAEYMARQDQHRVSS